MTLAKNLLKLTLYFMALLCSMQSYAAKKTDIPHFASFLKNIEPVIIHIQNDALAHGCPGTNFEFIATADGGTDYDELGTPHTYLSNAVLTTNCDINLTINATIQDGDSNNIPVPNFVKSKTISYVSLSPGNAGPWKFVSNIDTSLKRFKGAGTTAANKTSILSKISDFEIFDEGKYNTTPSNVIFSGAGCTNNRDCWSGVCTGGSCTAVSLGYLGDACTKHSDCASGSCAAGACTISITYQACGDNADCESGTCTAGACANAPELGGPSDPCTTSAECNFSCYVDGGYCLAESRIFDNGANCTATYDCASNLCNAGTCDPGTFAIGEICSYHQECSSNNCTGGFCANGLAGDSCDDHSNCLGTCSGGTCEGGP